MSQIENPGRMRFVKRAILSGVGLRLGFQLSSPSESQYTLPYSPNAWISIFEDDRIVIKIAKMGMGPDISGMVTAIICEALDFEPQNISIEFASTPFAPQTIATIQRNSTSRLWLSLRQAGAAVRQLLLNVAAEQWQLPSCECFTRRGRIFNKANSQSLTYSQLIQDVACLDWLKNEAQRIKGVNEMELVLLSAKASQAVAGDLVSAQFGLAIAKTPGKLSGKRMSTIPMGLSA